jgi:antitoxin Phd
MMVYTYSEARQNFSKILDEVETSGKVLIRRKDGRVYELTSANLKRSPLDVPSIKAEITTEEIVSLIRKGRDKGRTSA